MLGELDADLARQEAAVRERRARLRALLDMKDGLPAEGPVSPGLAALFRDMARVTDSPMAAKDRELLALIETSAAPEAGERVVAALSDAFAVPGGQERAVAAYALLDGLADADPADPRVDEAARALVDCLPREVLPEPFDVGSGDSFLRAFYADFPPAQAEAVRRALVMISERG
ncbi:hypothetical protein [Streptomyces sp. NPDC054756]